MSVSTVCVLRSGADFRPEHVRWLTRQVPGLLCLSDVPVPGVETIALRHDWPKWWSKLEAFNPALIAGDVLLMDLDTVVFELPQMPSETTVLPDFYRPTLMGSGFIYVTERDRRGVWDAFNRDPMGHMRRCTTRLFWGDQGFLQQHLGSAPRWGDDVCSYKVHCRNGVPAGTKVVCFHGRPRPWDVKAPWIPAMRVAA